MKKRFSLGDIKPLTNEDPLWREGLLRQSKSPLSLHVKEVTLTQQQNKDLNEMMSLLSCLFGLSRFWQTMYPGHVSCAAKMLCPADEFENASLTSKCWRQLGLRFR